MITIFNGRSFGLDGQKSSIYVQLAVTMREHIGEFNTGKSLTPFAVFMEIAKGARTSIDYDVALASADLATVHRRASPVSAWRL